MEFNHFMVDLETMGTGNNAAIVSIGVCAFNLEARTLGPTFYCNVNLEDAVKHGGVIDASTVMFWLNQSDAARKAFTDPIHKPKSVATAVKELNIFFKTCCKDFKKRCVWGNASTFDNIILKNFIELADNALPWPFWGDRCYRTVKNLRPDLPIERKGTHHHALDDATSQAEHLFKVYDALGL